MARRLIVAVAHPNIIPDYFPVFIELDGRCFLLFRLFQDVQLHSLVFLNFRDVEVDDRERQHKNENRVQRAVACLSHVDEQTNTERSVANNLVWGGFKVRFINF